MRINIFSVYIFFFIEMLCLFIYFSFYFFHNLQVSTVIFLKHLQILNKVLYFCYYIWYFIFNFGFYMFV